MEQFKRAKIVMLPKKEDSKIILWNNKIEKNLLTLKDKKRQKTSWNREEVLNLLYDVNRGVFRYEANFDLDKFIEENL